MKKEMFVNGSLVNDSNTKNVNNDKVKKISHSEKFVNFYDCFVFVFNIKAITIKCQLLSFLPCLFICLQMGKYVLNRLLDFLV